MDLLYGSWMFKASTTDVLKKIIRLDRFFRQRKSYLPLRTHKARPLTNHCQAILQKTTLPEDVTVVFDMDAYNFS
jgi:hypothetical protein